MKKIILFTLTFCQVLFLSAQSLNITGLNSIMYNSTTISGLDTLDPCLQTHSYLTIKNTSDKEHNILCEKNILSESSGSDNYFCWGGNCYPVGAFISTSSLALSSGQADDISFGGYFDAYCADAQAIVKYCFYPDVQPADKSCVYITYHGAATLISENNPLIISDFYPNPSKEIIIFDYYLNTPANLTIIDILGNKLKYIELDESKKYKVDVSELKQGIYFGNLVLNNELVSTKKIIIK